MVDVDAVVVGSGAGGLAAAVGLANAGQSVLVLEQHTLPGGWCHSFDLEGFRFSPGVHYVGELQEGGRYRRVLEGLGVGGDLVFNELDPEGYDQLRVGRVALDVPRGRARHRERLAAAFPHDAPAIEAAFDTLAELHDALVDGSLMRRPGLWRRGVQPLATTLAPIAHPAARALLSLQGGDHGLPPSRCPTVLHAGVLGHYFEGAWTPKGGGRALPKAFLKQLRRRGGQIRVGTPVSRILVERGRAVGVRLESGETIRAHHVVSNADPMATFGRLLGPEHVPARFLAKLRRTRWSVACLSLFLAADVDPATLGMGSGNRWVLFGDDAEAMDRYARRPDPWNAPVPGLFVTCTTAKDPSSRRDGLATFEVFAFVSWDAFAPWVSPSGQRPPAYLEAKERLMERMLAALDQALPGLRGRLVFRSLGTPLTNRHYVAAHRGAIYGVEKSLDQLGPLAWPTKVMKGLTLCGASTLSHGVAGATFSGVAAAAVVLGVGVGEVLSTGGPPVRTVLAGP